MSSLVRLTDKLANNKLPKLEGRIEKMQIKYDILKYEIEERDDLLYRYNEKIIRSKLIVQQLKKSSQEVRKEFLIAYNENQRLQKLVHDFKNNDEVFLNIQTIAEEKVKALFGEIMQ